MTADALELDLPLPPSLNEMIALAKQRTRRSRTGGWMKKALPVVYDQHLEAYETKARALIRLHQVQLPATPWPRWRLVAAELRVHNLRDLVELLASLKWPVDVLVRMGVVAGDSPRELIDVCIPTQRIDRRRPGIHLTLVREPSSSLAST